jgi:DNA-binding transcriptional LysR family regulator
MGLGYAWYAEENIREELDAGLLSRLPLTEGAERFATLYLVYADREAAGPGTRRLVEIIRELVAENCRVVADEPRHK